MFLSLKIIICNGAIQRKESKSNLMEILTVQHTLWVLSQITSFISTFLEIYDYDQPPSHLLLAFVTFVFAI